jgi:hypothetical protein
MQSPEQEGECVVVGGGTTQGVCSVAHGSPEPLGVEQGQVAAQPPPTSFQPNTPPMLGSQAQSQPVVQSGASVVEVVVLQSQVVVVVVGPRVVVVHTTSGSTAPTAQNV